MSTLATPAEVPGLEDYRRELSQVVSAQLAHA
jgi:hypothetical protein